MREKLANVSPITWNILFGTLFGRIATSMSIPFLAIYLTSVKNVSPGTTGAIIAISSLIGIGSSFFGGYLSDRWGRKKILLLSIFAWALVFIGFAFIDTIGGFFILNALNGLCRSIFEPTSRAVLSDLTDEKNRLVIFNLRYTAINIGVTFGPLIGLKLGSAATTTPFLLAAITYIIYGISLIYTLSKNELPTSSNGKNQVQLKDAFFIIRKDSIFLLAIVGLILSITGYSQLTSTLPQYFSISPDFKNGVDLFSYLLSLNAITVILLQYPLINIGKKYSPLVSIIFGNIVLSISLIGFAIITNLPFLIVMIVLFTIGEILMFSMTDILIDNIAKDELKGTYFGAMGFTQLGSVFGPWIGGVLLDHFGANQPIYLFGSLFFVTILGVPFLLFASYLTKSKLMKQKTSVQRVS